MTPAPIPSQESAWPKGRVLLVATLNARAGSHLGCKSGQPRPVLRGDASSPVQLVNGRGKAQGGPEPLAGSGSGPGGHRPAGQRVCAGPEDTSPAPPPPPRPLRKPAVSRAGARPCAQLTLGRPGATRNRPLSRASSRQGGLGRESRPAPDEEGRRRAAAREAEPGWPWRMSRTQTSEGGEDTLARPCKQRPRVPSSPSRLPQESFQGHGTEEPGSRKPEPGDRRLDRRAGWT